MSRGSLVCGFCRISKESKITGPLLKNDDVVAHENCLYYSSSLYNRNTPDGDDLLGFALDDVRDEMKRGNRLKCHKCKRAGATVGCEVKTCKRSYHFPCAVDDNAKKVEDESKGIFRIYCDLHKQRSEEDSNGNGSIVESLRHTDDKDESGDSDVEVMRKRPCPPARSDAKRRKCLRGSVARRILDDEDSPASDRDAATYEFEQAPLESDLDDSAESKPNVRSADPTLQSVTTRSEQGQRGETFEVEHGRNCEDDPCPLTSAGVHVPPQTEDGDGDDTDIGSDQDTGSPSVLAGITHMESISNRHPGTFTLYNACCPKTPEPSPNEIRESKAVIPGGSSSESPSRAVLFWRMCHEAGCVETVFTAFVSAMTAISGRILSDQASEEDCALSLKVLEASGMLPQIFEQEEKEFEARLANLQRESEGVEKSLSAIRRASKLKVIS